MGLEAERNTLVPQYSDGHPYDFYHRVLRHGL